jgi:hypothetical protein
MIKGLFLKEREGQKNTINYMNRNIVSALITANTWYANLWQDL